MKTDNKIVECFAIIVLVTELIRRNFLEPRLLIYP